MQLDCQSGFWRVINSDEANQSETDMVMAGEFVEATTLVSRTEM
jgi:hypothetical protein